jgi:YqaJ-like viral recombinase domain
MSLTAEQIRLRAGKLTASRVSALMTGDAEKILRLYREMIGEAVEEDLSDVWAVQLGAATESLNLDWYEMRRNPLSRRGEVVVHPRHDWAAATIDAWDDTLFCPVECKHVGGREDIGIIVDRYQPQMQWQMEVATASQCGLSVIMGASPPIVEYIERDADYAAEMIHRGAQFMECVAQRIVPVHLAPVAGPVVVSKHYDMSGDNRWGAAAAAWLMTKVAARDHAEAEKDLKEIMPPDAKKCTGYGVAITRDRAGRLSLREIT